MDSTQRRDAWQELMAQQQRLQGEGRTIADLLAVQPHLQLQAASIHADLSKHKLDDAALRALLNLARSSNLEARRAALFDGAPVNCTEQRPALHVALRGHRPSHYPNATQLIREALVNMQAFVNAVQQQRWLGFSGAPVNTIVHLGIGGSDLGPAMAAHALVPWQHKHIRCHFVANLDPDQLAEVLQQVNAEHTLFIVASKSFGTLETLRNARSAKQWYLQQGGDAAAIDRHFIAITSNTAAAVAFGIAEKNIFPMWDWVGGRFSICSSIGLPVALATSMDTFYELLEGAHAMDQHFLHTPFEQNLPVIMGLLAVWYRNAWNYPTHAVLPYAHRLSLFPAYLQQLEMESLGKHVDCQGQPLVRHSGPVIWGCVGTNGQHSFHQLLHQGTETVTSDFIAVARHHHEDACLSDQHDWLLANCLAQSRALMLGRSAEDVRTDLQQRGLTPAQIEELTPHLMVPGNRPSTTLLLEQLDARSLGALIALYEHKVFVQSVLWDINAFDQWGVELGKVLSGPVHTALQGQAAAMQQMDVSTRSLIESVQRLQNRNRDD